MVQSLDAVGSQDRQILHLQPQVAVLHQGTVDVQRYRMAHHHVRQLLGRSVAGGHVPDIAALAEHRHPVGHVHDLVELVGDDDQGLAVCLHISHDIEEPVRLLGGQHGGGLIQDQDVCAPVEDLDDLHRLLLRHGHVVDLLVGINGKTIFLTDLQDFGGGGLQIQLALSVQPQDDVFRCGEHVHQLEVLVDHADAAGKGVLGGGDGGGLAVHQDLPFVREVDAGQHIHQCGLAAAVLPQQGEDFAPPDLQGDIVVGNHLAEPLCDVPQFNGSGMFQTDHPFF